MAENFNPEAAKAAKATASKTFATKLGSENVTVLGLLTAEGRAADDAFKKLGTKASNAGEIMQALGVARPTPTEADEEHTTESGLGNRELLEALNRAFEATVSRGTEVPAAPETGEAEE